MSSRIFMRGQLDPTKLIPYFLVGRSQGAYFIYQDVPPTIPVTTATGVFASIKYVPGSPQPQPKLVFLTQGQPGVYTLRSSISAGGSNTNFVASEFMFTPNVLELAPAAGPGTPMRLIPTPSMNVGTQALWSGVWYRPQTLDGYGLRWKQRPTLQTTGTFRGAADTITITAPDFEIMLVPRDAGSSNDPISVWINGSCKTPQGADAALRLWCGWVDGDPGESPSGCEGPGWLAPGGQARGCNFTSVAACKQGYLYTICDEQGTCGPCLGPCPIEDGTIPVCTHDYDPALIGKSSPLTCNPIDPTTPSFWKQYGLWVILALVVGLIIVIILIVLIAKVAKSSKQRRQATS